MAPSQVLRAMKDSSDVAGHIDPLEPAPIIADFKQAIAATGSARARPDSALVDTREQIILALFDDVKRKNGFLSATEITELQRALSELQAFVPPDDAVIVAAYENAKRNHELSSFPRRDRQQAHAVVDRIEAGKAAVANFRYSEPEYLRMGASVMTQNTRTWSEPLAAKEALQAGTGEAYGCLVYASSGITAIALIAIGQAPMWSIQFWGLVLGILGLISIAVSAAPLLSRIDTRLEELDSPRRWVAYGFLFTVVVALPVLVCLLIVRILNVLAPQS